MNKEINVRYQSLIVIVFYFSSGFVRDKLHICSENTPFFRSSFEQVSNKYRTKPLEKAIKSSNAVKSCQMWSNVVKCSQMQSK